MAVPGLVPGIGPAIHAFDASKRRQGRGKAETIVSCYGPSSLGEARSASLLRRRGVDGRHKADHDEAGQESNS
jgi:hypothetical protein